MQVRESILERDKSVRNMKCIPEANLEEQGW